MYVANIPSSFNFIRIIVRVIYQPEVMTISLTAAFAANLFCNRSDALKNRILDNSTEKCSCVGRMCAKMQTVQQIDSYFVCELPWTVVCHLKQHGIDGCISVEFYHSLNDIAFLSVTPFFKEVATFLFCRRHFPLLVVTARAKIILCKICNVAYEM